MLYSLLHIITIVPDILPRTLKNVMGVEVIKIFREATHTYTNEVFEVNMD